MIITNLINQVFGVGTPFVATVSGDWNASATWGNTGSPAVKGVDYPGNAADAVTINASVVVKYNVVETNELGNVTVNGTLWFPLDATTKMTFGHTNLTIGATGKLITSSDGTIGNVGNVGSSYVMSLIWNTTADNSRGLVITNGAYIDVRGDDALYGGNHSTTLATNWSSGQTLTAVGAAPLSWVAGHTITVAKNLLAGITTTLRYTIASVAANGGNTDITIVEAAPAISFIAGGNIENEARNVRFYKLGAETPAMTTVYTLRPGIFDNHITGTIKWKDVQVTGFNRYDGFTKNTGATFTFENYIVRNGNYGLSRIQLATLTSCNGYSHGNAGFDTLIDCLLTSCNSYMNSSNGFNVIDCSLTNCNVYSNSYGFNNCKGSAFMSCNAYSNSYNFFSFRNCTLTNCNSHLGTYSFYILNECTLIGCIAYSTSYFFVDCNIMMINSSVGWNGAVSMPSANSDIVLPCKIILINVKVPNAGFTFQYRNTDRQYAGKVLCQDYNQVAGEWRCFENFGTITKVASPSGFRSPSSLLVEPLSLASTINTIPLFNWITFGIPLYLPTASTKVSLWVLGQNWSVFPTNTELWLELDYFAGADGTRTTVKSTQVLSANDVVTELSVTVTPTIAGIAYARAYMCKYETDSTHKIYLDGAIAINDEV